MKRIENLNLLTADKIIMDAKNRIFVIRQINKYRDNTCHLDLTELNEEFTSWSLTLPAACDGDYVFESVNDRDFQFELYESNVTKQEVWKLLSDGLKKILNEKL